MSDAFIDHTPRNRAHSAREWIADSCVHVLGLVVGLTGAIVLIVLVSSQPDATKFAAVLIYSAGLLAMLGASAAYNMGYSTRFRIILRRCDHSAILLMIAGTYTPFTLHFYSGLYALALTSLVWCTALSGIGIKLLDPELFERLSVAIFLGLGWLALIVLGPLFPQLPTSTLIALVAGGALYSGGIIFHLWESLPFQNAIWHVFVLAAAICHYIAVLDGVVLGKISA